MTALEVQPHGPRRAIVGEVLLTTNCGTPIRLAADQLLAESSSSTGFITMWPTAVFDAGTW
jgi:hypothetical protein